MYTPIVRHWRRGDLDRLYVTTASGRQLGCYDLVDETLLTATEGLRPLMWRAVTDFRLARKSSLPADRDLASHQAGMWELECASRCVVESPLFFSASTVCQERDERSEWQLASERAIEIAEVVDRMAGGWVALHGVPSGRHAERLDHVLIGPAGVVVVLSEHVQDGEVVAAGDSVTFDGTKQKIVTHLGKLADHVGTRVPEGTPVYVVVAVHGAPVKRRGPLSDDRTLVVAAHDLVAVVGTLPTPLDDAARDALFTVLRRKATWSPRGKHGSTRSADPAMAFAGLQLLDGLPLLSPRPVAAHAAVAVKPAIDTVVASDPAPVATEPVPPRGRPRHLRVASTRPTAA